MRAHLIVEFLDTGVAERLRPDGQHDARLHTVGQHRQGTGKVLHKFIEYMFVMFIYSNFCNWYLCISISHFRNTLLGFEQAVTAWIHGFLK